MLETRLGAAMLPLALHGLLLRFFAPSFAPFSKFD